LVTRGRLTRAGTNATAQGQQEYQKLVDRFDGKVHLSRGRASAANARLKLSQSSKPTSASVPRIPKRLAKRIRKGATGPSRKTSEDETASEPVPESDAGATVPTTELVGEAREEKKTESALPKTANDPGRRGKKREKSEPSEAKKPETPQPTTKARKQKTKPGKSLDARVPRARLLELATRYKDNRDQFRAQKQTDDDVDASAAAVPEGEFEIEQLLCSDADGALLVKWAGYDQPSWEPASSIPVCARDFYLHQGRVGLMEYLALLDVAC
jgi:hypothetical protein